MDIVIGKTPYVKKDPEKKTVYDNEDKKKERRRSRRDRRKSVRGDVIVSISVPNDRRMHPERRRG